MEEPWKTCWSLSEHPGLNKGSGLPHQRRTADPKLAADDVTVRAHGVQRNAELSSDCLRRNPSA